MAFWFACAIHTIWTFPFQFEKASGSIWVLWISSSKSIQITRRVVKLLRFLNKATSKWMNAVDWMGVIKHLHQRKCLLYFRLQTKKYCDFFMSFDFVWNFWTFSVVFVYFFAGGFASFSTKSIFWTSFFLYIWFANFDLFSMNFQLFPEIFPSKFRIKSSDQINKESLKRDNIIK